MRFIETRYLIGIICQITVFKCHLNRLSTYTRNNNVGRTATLDMCFYFMPKRDEKLASAAVRLEPWAADVSLAGREF